MKKYLMFTMLIAMMVCLLAVPGHLQANETVVTPNKLIVFKIGDLNYYTQEIGSDQVNVVKMDAAPMISNSRTFVPVRFLGNALGVNDNDIVWDNNSRTATLKGMNELKLTIGRKTITVNNKETTIDVAPMVVAPGRTMLPARYVAEGLGFTVDWDDQNRLVIVYPEGSEKPDLHAILAKINGNQSNLNNLPVGYEKPEWNIIRRDVGRTFELKAERDPKTGLYVNRYFRFVCTSHPELNKINTYDWNGNPIVNDNTTYTTTYELAPGGQAYDIKLTKGMVVTFDVYEKINGVEVKVDTIVETL
jgi:hypothetical protein